MAYAGGAAGPPGGHGQDVAPDDIKLIGRVADEDEAAFESLYRAYHPRLARFLSGMLRQPALIEEVLDDTLLVVWRKAHTYDASCKLSTWIFAIAYRQALKALKRTGQEPVGAEAEEPAIPAHSGPDGQMHQRQVRRQVTEAMSLLSAEHRAVIELTYYHGHSSREVAEIMGCPAATVKTRMFYARQKLKDLLGPQGVQAL